MRPSILVLLGVHAVAQVRVIKPEELVRYEEVDVSKIRMMSGTEDR